MHSEWEKLPRNTICVIISLTEAKFWIDLQSNRARSSIKYLRNQSQMTASASFDNFSTVTQLRWVCFFHIMIGRNVSCSGWKNEMKSHDGTGNCGAQIKETLAGRAGCCHSSARLSAPARSRQALASTPIYYSGALLVSPQPKCQWQKQKSPQRFTRAQRTLLLLLRSTSRSLFCFILRSVQSYLGLHAHEGESNREPHQEYKNLSICEGYEKHLSSLSVSLSSQSVLQPNFQNRLNSLFLKILHATPHSDKIN